VSSGLFRLSVFRYRGAMATKKRDLARSYSLAVALDELKALAVEAKFDAAVGKKLGPTYLKAVDKQIKDAEASLAESATSASSKKAATSAAKDAAKKLLAVMQEIRDDAQLHAADDATQHLLGKGQRWSLTGDVAHLALAANAMANALHDSHLAHAAGIDARHVHDLVSLASTVSAMHVAHAGVVKASKASTAARDQLFAGVRATAHHIRLAARLVHRGDAAGLGRFTPSAARHKVAHKPAQPAA
jgi:hypothetical protein